MIHIYKKKRISGNTQRKATIQLPFPTSLHPLSSGLPPCGNDDTGAPCPCGYEGQVGGGEEEEEPRFPLCEFGDGQLGAGELGGNEEPRVPP